MEPSELLKLAGQGGFALVLLVGFLWFLRTVGMSIVTSFRESTRELVAAMRELGLKFEAHTQTDVAHHQDVKLEIVSLRGEISGIAYERERTPVPSEMPTLLERPSSRVRTRPEGVPIPRRPTNRNE